MVAPPGANGCQYEQAAQVGQAAGGVPSATGKTPHESWLSSEGMTEQAAQEKEHANKAPQIRPAPTNHSSI